MKTKLFMMVACSLILLTLSAFGQPARKDVIWARNTPQAITLDGNLNEPAWAAAESVAIRYGGPLDPPGNGYRLENGVQPTDPLRATFKFLVHLDTLYMGVIVRDSSVGGGLFNQFDGLLMNMRNHASPNRPAPSFEYFYAWVTETWGCDTVAGQVGALPCFMGWAAGDRTVWDARTVVNGITNIDATPDVGYTMELRFNLRVRGYNVTRTQGDIIEFNVSVYDADWRWPVQPGRFSGNRTWLQGPWGNASWYNVLRIYARPDVSITSGPAPVIGPDARIPNGVNFASPVIDGRLDEAVWRAADAHKFDIRFGDSTLRASYPGIGPWRSGQFQPEIGGRRAPVLDPADATIRWFFKDDTLFLSADVRDLGVWSLTPEDQWDGIRFAINEKVKRNIDSVLISRDLTVRVDSLGRAKLEGYLPFLRDTLGGARVGLRLKGGTTVNNFNDLDSGFTIELAVTLTRLGFTAGRGDGMIYISACVLDAENFSDPLDNYANRAWWYRERTDDAAPAVTYLDPTLILTSVRIGDQLPQTYTLFGNYPNPFNPSTKIRYAIPTASDVTLEVFNVLGQRVASMPLGSHLAGEYEIPFDAAGLSSGLYMYRLQMKEGAQLKATLTGKMMLLR